jgi:hypothetical protein
LIAAESAGPARYDRGMTRAAVPASAVALFLYLWWGQWAEVNCATWLATAIAIGGSTAAVFDRGVASSVAMMLGVAGFTFSRTIGHWPFTWDAMPDARYAAFITAANVIAATGLCLHRSWARWIAIALASGAALTGALNAINLLHVGGRVYAESTWFASASAFGGAAMLLALTRPELRAKFHRDHDAVWTSPDAIVRWGRIATIACCVAGAMLLLYALGQPVAPATRTPALVLAPLLLIGSALFAARRTIGLAILGGAGIALLAQTAVTFAEASDRAIAAFYATAWLPAGLAAVFAAVLALRRAR